MAEQPQHLEPPPSRSRGRRGGGEDTREKILVAARVEFAERGYHGASVRGIARRANVDPALVRYWFEGGKPEVFSSALLDPSINPARIAEMLSAGSLEDIGVRVVEVVLGLWEGPGGRERFRMVIAGTLSGQGVDAMRDYLTQEVFGRWAKRLDGPDAQLRMNLVGSHMVGLMMARYGLGMEPLASTPLAEVARRVGPVIQQYIAPLLERPDGVGQARQGARGSGAEEGGAPGVEEANPPGVEDVGASRADRT